MFGREHGNCSERMKRSYTLSFNWCFFNSLCAIGLSLAIVRSYRDYSSVHVEMCQSLPPAPSEEDEHG